jgi:hypothetical protein
VRRKEEGEIYGEDHRTGKEKGKEKEKREKIVHR